MNTITTLLAAARLLLSGLLLAAAAGKLLHRKEFAVTLENFGVPRRLRSRLAGLLPTLELAIAAALVVPASVWSGACAGTTLLGVYTAVLGYKLAQGERPACNCFGQGHAAPIGARTLLRNAALLLCAGGLVYAGPRYPHAPLASFPADAPALSLCLAAMAAQWWLLYHLLRQNGRLLLKMDAVELRLDAANIPAPGATDGAPPRGLAVGSMAPGFTLQELGGDEPISLGQLRSRGLPIVLVFSDMACAPCRELAPLIDRWHRDVQRRVTLAVITRDDAKQLHHPRPAGSCTTLLQRDREVAANYDALVTPSAVLISTEGTIGSHLAAGSKEIYELLRSSAPPDHGEREIAA